MPQHPSALDLYPISARVRRDSTHRAGSIRGYVPSRDVLLVRMDRPSAAGACLEEVRPDDLTRLPDELPLADLVAAAASQLSDAWVLVGTGNYGTHVLAEAATGVTVGISADGGQDDDLATLTLGEFGGDAFVTLPPAVSLDAAAVLLRSAVLSARSALLDVGHPTD
jgi:hypothetical protein